MLLKNITILRSILLIFSILIGSYLVFWQTDKEKNTHSNIDKPISTALDQQLTPGPKENSKQNKEPSYNHKANLIWSENNNNVSKIKFKQFYDHAWHETEIVESTASSSNYSPSIGGDSNNALIAVWSSKGSKLPTLKYSTRNSNGGWQTSRYLTQQGGENLSSSIIFDTSNNPWVFWSSDKDGYDDIYQSTWLNEQWTPPSKVHADNDVPDITPKPSLEDNGDITVQWRKFNPELPAYLPESYTYKNKNQQTAQASKLQTNHLETSINDIDLSSLNIRSTRLYIHFPENRINKSTSIILR